MIQAATSDDCIAEDWATFVDIADRVKAFKDPEQCVGRTNDSLVSFMGCNWFMSR